MCRFRGLCYDEPQNCIAWYALLCCAARQFMASNVTTRKYKIWVDVCWFVGSLIQRLPIEDTVFILGAFFLSSL